MKLPEADDSGACPSEVTLSGEQTGGRTGCVYQRLNRLRYKIVWKKRIPLLRDIGPIRWPASSISVNYAVPIA
ncbi:MAG TPA: hypothetical protein DEB39_11355 [Planctomycetaceae bacterium]|nr:hypothetical protein [Planctomycetaceae bacterium]